MCEFINHTMETCFRHIMLTAFSAYYIVHTCISQTFGLANYFLSGNTPLKEVQSHLFITCSIQPMYNSFVHGVVH